ncbi:MAG: hypothetical protein R3A79_11900 [Nannocystaceae bacterium]
MLSPVLSPVVSPLVDPVFPPVSELAVVADAELSLVEVVVELPALALAPELLLPALAVALPSEVLLLSLAPVVDDPDPEALVIGSSPLHAPRTSGRASAARRT